MSHEVCGGEANGLVRLRDRLNTLLSRKLGSKGLGIILSCQVRKGGCEDTTRKTKELSIVRRESTEPDIFFENALSEIKFRDC